MIRIREDVLHVFVVEEEYSLFVMDFATMSTIRWNAPVAGVFTTHLTEIPFATALSGNTLFLTHTTTAFHFLLKVIFQR